jgi:hypothetical protein
MNEDILLRDSELLEAKLCRIKQVSDTTDIDSVYSWLIHNQSSR